MLTSRPVPLTASCPLHTKTPGRALQKARGILQENALQGPRTAKTLRVQLQTPSKGGSPSMKQTPLPIPYLTMRRRVTKEVANGIAIYEISCQLYRPSTWGQDPLRKSSAPSDTRPDLRSCKGKSTCAG